MAPVKYYKLRLIAGGLYIALVIIMSLVRFFNTGVRSHQKQSGVSFHRLFHHDDLVCPDLLCKILSPAGDTVYITGNIIRIYAGNFGHTGISSHRHAV